MTEATLSIDPKEKLSPPIDALLVFGSGPVVDRETRERAESVGTPIGSEDINFWSYTLADATNILLEHNQAGKVIVMGGRTGGDVYKSEAELIAEQIQTHTPVLIEDASLNTLENLVNALNLYIDDPSQSSQFKKLGIVAQHFHLPRVKLLMDLFDIPYTAGFSSEKVVGFDAAQKGDMETVDEIEDRLDVSQDISNPNSYYGKKLGTEKLDIRTRFLQNDAYTKELFDYPEYWLCYVGILKSETRIRGMLSKLNPEILKQKFQIDMDAAVDEIKKRLVVIERIDLPVTDLMAITWTDGNKKQLDEIIAKRNP